MTGRLMLGAALLVLLADCSSSATRTSGCDTSADCQGSASCIAGQCRASCSDATACGFSEACVDGFCLPSLCGDGIRGNDEQCDEGPNNSDERACTLLCRNNVCGDGRLFEGVEECDGGVLNSDFVANSCRTDCTLPRCGDRVIDQGEACDDGNTVTENCVYGREACEVCDAGCEPVSGATSFCGDSITDATQGETCDDGNAVTERCPPGVACTVCTAQCVDGPGVPATCGDGIVDLDGVIPEQCDEDSPGCVDCRIQPGWVCEDGCALVRYRVAVIDLSANGGLRVRDVRASGGPVRVRDVLRGANVASAAPNWSFDSRLVAYPTGDQLGQTYLYEGSGAGTAFGYFHGTEPDFLDDTGLKVLARSGTTLLEWERDESDDQTGTSTPLAPSGARTPRWRPGSSTELAFVANATNQLVFYDGASESILTAGVQRFAWDPSGDRLAALSGSGACALTIRDLTTAPIAVTTVATGLACDAAFDFTPDGGTIVLAAATALFRFEIAAAPYDAAANEGLRYTHSGPMTDVDVTSDGAFAAFLGQHSGAGSRAVFLLPLQSGAPIDTGVACDCDAMAIAPEVLTD